MIKVGIVGASGYTGGELIRILLSHPEVELNDLCAREMAGKSLWKAHPNMRNVNLRFSKYSDKILDNDVICLSVPHTAAMEKVPTLLESTKVIDLSADFRLQDQKTYEKWYESKHTAPELLKERVYGVPELHRDEIKKANLVACAGCEATSAILGLAPLKGKAQSVIVDAKIGGSGSGKKVSLGTHYPERATSIRPYAPEKHRHSAEIEQELGIKVSMSAHAVDLVRGILTTNHVQGYTAELNEVRDLYKEFYKDSPFVRVTPTQVQNLPNPKYVLGSNYCDVGFARDEEGERLVVFSALDNLIKGAAGQAVQCMNLMFGFKEQTGLEQLPLYPI